METPERGLGQPDEGNVKGGQNHITQMKANRPPKTCSFNIVPAEVLMTTSQPGDF